MRARVAPARARDTSGFSPFQYMDLRDCIPADETLSALAQFETCWMMSISSFVR
jgi:hypothetical protein